MKLKPTLQIRRRAQMAVEQLSHSFQMHWLRVALLGTAAYMAYHKDMDIDLQLSQAPASMIQSVQTIASVPSQRAKAVNTSLLSEARPTPQPKPAKKTKATKTPSRAESMNVSNLANTYSNLTSEDKGEAKRENATARVGKKRKQQNYVERFAKVAQSEMEKYGIPASITLAQGLLESNVGESRLATRNNNHFGVKCFSRSCGKGHCSNFTDDSHKDFFRIYKSAWESYRAHSLLLKRKDRYKPLFKLRSTDYRGWAYGLKKAGYATDPNYPEKLINLIESLKLDRFDR